MTMVQAALKAEMTEAIGAAKGEREAAAPFAGRHFFGDRSQ
jgi:transposase-like protein